MLTRQPVAAGRFYPGNAAELKKEVDGWMSGAGDSGESIQPWASMLPHAGYVFCGNIIARTLAGQQLKPRQIILCPNHTGRGKMLGVWPEGEWITPMGAVPVDKKLADEIMQSAQFFEPDTLSHLGEHSIEVLLPFLLEQRTDLSITPITVGTQNPKFLAAAGKALASVLVRPENTDVGLIISSDMNHYENEKMTLLKDDLALREAVDANPDKLLATVHANHISMCGAGPLALALYAAQYLGGVQVELVAHDTSAKASDDYDHTVGYAGLRLFLKGAKQQGSGAA